MAFGAQKISLFVPGMAKTKTFACSVAAIAMRSFLNGAALFSPTRGCRKRKPFLSWNTSPKVSECVKQVA